MKRVKAACICQTLHFMLKEDVAHDLAVRQVEEEVKHYKRTLERNRTLHKIVEETAQPDGSVIIKECKPYCQGLHIMALGWEDKVPMLLEKAGL